MNVTTSESLPNAVSEEGPKHGFGPEFLSCWHALNYKAFFFTLLAAWMALFVFFGNSTLGYVKTDSLLGWLWDIYSSKFGEDGHGKLILPVVLVLFWWKRKELLAIPQRTWWPAALLIAFALVIHLFGYFVQQPRLSVLAMFLGIYGLIGLTWGPAWLKATFFPFLLFAFCMPMGSYVESITFPLRVKATQITYFVTHDIFGIQLIKRGTQLFNATGGYSYDVAAACSGIRSLISLLALTTIYGMTVFHTWWKQILVIALAVPLALACNVIRLSSFILGAEAFGQDAGNFIHEWSGFLTYAVAIAVMLLIGKWLRERPTSSSTTPPSAV